jgi:hypothetical protein
METRTWKVIGGILGLVGLGLVGWSIYANERERDLELHGKRARGTVVSKFSHRPFYRNNDSREIHSLTVEYEVEGKEYRKKINVTYRTYVIHSEEDVVGVIYDPNEPEHARLLGGGESWSSWKALWYGIGAMFGGLVSWMLSSISWPKSREWRDPTGPD